MNAPDRLRYPARVVPTLVAAALAYLREMRGNHIPLVLAIVQPGVFLVISLEANPVGFGQAETLRLITGVGLTSLWSVTIWGAGGILRREMSSGTLGAMLTLPCDLRIVLLGKCMGATLRGSLSVGAVCVAVPLLFGHLPEITRPGLLGLAILLAVVSALACGLLLSCVFLAVRHPVRVTEALMYPVLIISGLMIPIDLLPGWIQPVSALVSFRWIQQVFQAAGGVALPPVAIPASLALTAAYAVAGLLLFRVLLERARRRGTIDLV